MNKIYRTITKNSLKDKYKVSNIDNKNCHIGQKKLLFAEIEFLNYVSKYIDINDSLIVYIGASPGYHLNIIRKLFPDKYMLLYDPLPININLDNNIKIIDGKDGFFNDNKCKDIIDYQQKINKKYLIYISDIRTRESFKEELSVWNDMLKQQRWGILMNADYMSIKFRLPWLNEQNNENLKYKFDIDKIENKIEYLDDQLLNGDILYLKGKIFIQIYANKFSTETRLFIKKNKNNKYYITKYNCYDYEEKLFYHNSINKQKNYKFKKSNMLENNLIGYDNSYDCVSEYFIIYKYLKFFKKDKMIKYTKKIINILYDISFKYSKYIMNKYNLFCLFYIYIEYIKNIDDTIKDNIKQDKRIIIINTITKYNTVFQEYENVLNNNIEKLYNNKCNFLTKIQINYIINKIKKYKIILNYNNNKYNLLKFDSKLNKFVINITDIIKINNLIIKKINLIS